MACLGHSLVVMVNLSLEAGREGVDWWNAHLSRCRGSLNKEAVFESAGRDLCLVHER